MTSFRRSADPVLARIVTLFAALIAIATTVTLPAACYLAAYATQRAELAAEANIAAAALSQLASRNPELWVFENARMRGLLGMIGRPPQAERRTIVTTGGQIVVDDGDALPWPLLSTTSPIYDSGLEVGSISIRRSQRPMLILTAGVAMMAGVLGALAFVVLRTLPLRLLHGALARSAHLATHDTLTGLPNRALFQDRLEQSLAWSRREGATLAVLYLDLDRFKNVNDTLGHAAGDCLLVQITDRLRACVRETDTLARLGGDEFAIVQVGVHQLGDIELLAQRLINTADRTFELNGCLATVGLSIGIALRGLQDAAADDDAGRLLQEADVALYRAKEEGRGTYRFYSAEMNLCLLQRRAMEADLLAALQGQQFSLRYQPQYDLLDRRIIGAEALLRWNHPLRGEVPTRGVHFHRRRNRADRPDRRMGPARGVQASACLACAGSDGRECVAGAVPTQRVRPTGGSGPGTLGARSRAARDRDHRRRAAERHGGDTCHAAPLA